MLSDIPKDLSKVSKENIDKEICRVGMIAELDAVNLYEQLAAMAQDKTLKTVLLDIAKEEKTHVGEFETVLLQKDKEQVLHLRYVTILHRAGTSLDGTANARAVCRRGVGFCSSPAERSPAPSTFPRYPRLLPASSPLG